MFKFKDLFLSSYRELKNVRCIVTAALLGAISIVLGISTVMVGNFLKVGFTYIPNTFVFYLFGPFVGAFYGAAMDILTFIIKPTGTYFFGFTLSAILTGILYGVILYHKPLSIKRIFTANLLHMILINIILNTLWLTILYGDAYLALLPVRTLKAIIMLPIETFTLFGLMKAIEATGVLRIFREERVKI